MHNRRKTADRDTIGHGRGQELVTTRQHDNVSEAAAMPPLPPVDDFPLPPMEPLDLLPMEPFPEPEPLDLSGLERETRELLNRLPEPDPIVLSLADLRLPDLPPLADLLAADDFGAVAW